MNTFGASSSNPKLLQYTVLILLGFMMEAFIGLMSYVYQVVKDIKRSQHIIMSSGEGDQGLG